VRSSSIAFADIDGDNDQDVLITGEEASLPIAKLYRNTSLNTDILTFTLAAQTGVATIDVTNNTITIEVAVGTDVTNLTPTITLATNSTVSPNSGVAQDFTNAVIYTVTAADGSTTQDWTVTVIVAKQDQTITFNPIEDQVIEAGSFMLVATASSGLAVTYEVVSGPASVAGNEVTFNDFGMVTISASQAGNVEFNPATDIEQAFEIVTVTGLNLENLRAIQFYPNPTANFIRVTGEYDAIQIISTSGRVVYQASDDNNQIDVSALATGNYIVMISTQSGTETLRLIKQ